MPHAALHRRSFDIQSVARLARIKIFQEVSRRDPDLRLWVGHVNMYEKLNNSSLSASKQRISKCDSDVALRLSPSLCQDANPQNKFEYHDRDLMVDVAHAETLSTKHDQKSAVGDSVLSSDANDEETSDDNEHSDLSLPLARQIPRQTGTILTAVSGDCQTKSVSVVKVSKISSTI